MKPISLLALFALPLVLPLARGQVVERIDVDSQGQPGDYGSGEADISDDGRFVIFVGTATTFGGPDVYGTKDVFVRDRLLGTTSRLTSSLDASDPLRYSYPRISGNGSVVSYAKAGSVGGTATVRCFVHRLGTDITTEIVLPSLSNVLVTGLSLDGRFAAIQTGQIPNWSVYRLDLATRATVLCTRDGKGLPVVGRFGEIDDTGSRISFQSSAGIVLPDENNTSDMFVLDIPSDTMTRVSVSSDGSGGDAASYAGTISGNGRFASFFSIATNLSPLRPSGQGAMYLHDLATGSTSLVSVHTDGTPLSWGALERSCVSKNGESVAFNSAQPVDEGDGTSIDVMLRDLVAGTTQPCSPGDPVPVLKSSTLGINADGRQVLFFSYQPALLGNAQGPGIFVADFGPRCSTSGYCTALPNSTGAPATIGAQGDASREWNNLVIAGVGMPDNTSALLVSGSVAIDPGTPFGNGLLCIGGGMIRHGVHVANGGVILDHQDLNSPEYAGVNPGDTRYYQIFYRDPAAGGAMFNMTDGVGVVFCW